MHVPVSHVCSMLLEVEGLMQLIGIANLESIYYEDKAARYRIPNSVTPYSVL